MFMITGRAIYEVRSALHEKFGSDDLRRRARMLKKEMAGPTKMPGQEILVALEKSWPKQQRPRIFEGEAEYQHWLKAQKLRESSATDYESQTDNFVFPSVD